MVCNTYYFLVLFYYYSYIQYKFPYIRIIFRLQSLYVNLCRWGAIFIKEFRSYFIWYEAPESKVQVEISLFFSLFSILNTSGDSSVIWIFLCLCKNKIYFFYFYIKYISHLFISFRTAYLYFIFNVILPA